MSHEEFGKTYFSIPQALSILQSPTPQELIQKKQSGGQTLDYVSAATVIRTLNKVFGLRWSFTIHDTKIIPSQEFKSKPQGSVVQTLGELTVPGLGSRMQWGSQSIVGGQQQQEHAFKGSASDALKKCAAMFLVHLDLADEGPVNANAVMPSDLMKEDLKGFGEEEEVEEKQPEPVQETQPQQTAQAPQAQQGSEARVQEEPQIPQAVQESIDTVPEVQPSASNPTPVQPEQQQQQADRWSQEDIQELQEHKKRLNVETNEKLNPYIQEFFGNANMTFRQLTPITIKDFNHFLRGR